MTAPPFTTPERNSMYCAETRRKVIELPKLGHVICQYGGYYYVVKVVEEFKVLAEGGHRPSGARALFSSLLCFCYLLSEFIGLM